MTGDLDVVSYRPTAEDYAWVFGGVPAVLRVRPGTVLELYTEDCFAGRVRSVDDLPSVVCEFPYLNPVTGPFFVEGAEPGDTLALHFVAIEPARDWAVSSTFPHFGALTGTHQTATLHPPLEERVRMYDVDIERRVVTYRARNSDFSVELPLDSMHGTVGVAPAGFEARQTITPDAHGGNMDSPELRAGTTAYFAVNHEGALFAMGDGHCRQGHGEVCGTAVEAAMNTVVAVDLIKGGRTPTPWPRFETDDAIMSTGSTRPLEDAFRISQHDLITWLAAEMRLDLLDVYQLVSQAGQAPVGNVTDPNYTMLAKVDKSYLPGIEVYGGVHKRLRETASAYLARK
jgi:amidase